MPRRQALASSTFTRNGQARRGTDAAKNKHQPAGSTTGARSITADTGGGRVRRQAVRLIHQLAKSQVESEAAMDAHALLRQLVEQGGSIIRAGDCDADDLGEAIRCRRLCDLGAGAVVVWFPPGEEWCGHANCCATLKRVEEAASREAAENARLRDKLGA